MKNPGLAISNIFNWKSLSTQKNSKGILFPFKSSLYFSEVIMNCDFYENLQLNQEIFSKKVL
jgi:hypothetical protein